MCSTIRTGSISKLIGYTYPTLHTGKKWFVDFFALDPATNDMRRRRYYIGDNLKIAEKKRRAAEIIEALTRQLMQGWNPFVKAEEGTRCFVKFDDCVKRYLDYVERMDSGNQADFPHCL